MSIFDLASYKKPIEIVGTRSREDCAAAFQRMTRPQSSFWPEKNRPFIGGVGFEMGRMWFYPSLTATVGRTLVFRLSDDGVGCRLEGRLQVPTPIRIFSWSYVVFAFVGTLVLMATAFRYSPMGDWLYKAKLVTQGVLCAGAFMWGYNGLCVLVGRRREQLAVKIIRHVMNNETAEALVLDVLR